MLCVSEFSLRLFIKFCWLLCLFACMRLPWLLVLILWVTLGSFVIACCMCCWFEVCFVDLVLVTVVGLVGCLLVILLGYCLAVCLDFGFVVVNVCFGCWFLYLIVLMISTYWSLLLVGVAMFELMVFDFIAALLLMLTLYVVIIWCCLLRFGVCCELCCCYVGFGLIRCCLLLFVFVLCIAWWLFVFDVCLWWVMVGLCWLVSCILDCSVVWNFWVFVWVDLLLWVVIWLWCLTFDVVKGLFACLL